MFMLLFFIFTGNLGNEISDVIPRLNTHGLILNCLLFFVSLISKTIVCGFIAKLWIFFIMFILLIIESCDNLLSVLLFTGVESLSVRTKLKLLAHYFFDYLIRSIASVSAYFRGASHFFKKPFFMTVLNVSLILSILLS